MSKKLRSVIITGGALAILAALVFIFDAAGIAFRGATDRWYMLLAAYVGMIFLAVAIAYKKSFFVFLSALFIGIFASLEFMTINLYFYETWYLIPIFGGFGMIAANALGSGNRHVYLVGTVIMLSSIAMMAGVLNGVWRFVLPAVIIVVALIAIIKALLPIKQGSDTTDGVYYVEPNEDGGDGNTDSENK